jgi:hypothetical protein
MLVSLIRKHVSHHGWCVSLMKFEVVEFSFMDEVAHAQQHSLLFTSAPAARNELSRVVVVSAGESVPKLITPRHRY